MNSSSGGSSTRVFSLEKESDKLALLRLVHRSPLSPEEKNAIRDAIFGSAHGSAETPDLARALSGLGVALAGAASSPVEEVPLRPVQQGFGRSRSTPRFAAPSQPVAVTIPPLEPAPAPAPAAPAAEDASPQISKPQHAESQNGLAGLSARIAEIKQHVNAKIGNPVNLMDRDSEKGREYMSALLDAMKKQNGGAPEEITAARQRLEKAYTEILPLLDNDAAVPARPAMKAEPDAAPVQASAPLEKNPPVRTVPPPQKPSPALATAPVTSAPAAPRMTSVKQSLARQEPSKLPRERSASPATSASAEGMHSVAKEKQLQDLLRTKREEEMTSKKQQEEARIAAMDPLQTPEVSQGLQQLLSEWSLFKSSGFLGTGPNGMEHPLYKRIAQLTMAAVIAGRFEGATPAVKQNIADYMNGWRYEEGVLHEHTETFEHYLRRVIKHILEKQKQKQK